MSQNILGIDIGTYSIKVCMLSRSLREFELSYFLEQKINQSARLTHEEAVAASLRHIIEKNDLQADVSSVSLPSHLLSSRVISLPFSNLKKIEQTVQFELESYVPVPLDDLLVDYHILSIEENQSKILTSYIQRSVFIKYLDALEIAGIDPKFLSVDAIDLSHISQVAMIPQNEVYAILDIGHHKTNVVVMKGQQLQFVRSIGIGGIHFTRAIQKAFRLNYEKAEALKIERGGVSVEGEGLDQIGRLLQKVCEDLVVSVRQTYLGYKQLYKDEDWISIFLHGGGARLPGIAEVIASALRVNVSQLNFLDFIDHKIDNIQNSYDVIAPAFSQTLKVIFSNKAIKINFRRGEFAYQGDFKAIGSEMKQLGLWFSLVFILGLTHFLFSYMSLDSRIESMNKSIVESAVKALPELSDQKNKDPKQILNIVKSKVAEINPQLESLDTSSNQASPLSLLLEISKEIPEKDNLTLDVDDFSVFGSIVRLDGRTNSFEAVDKIKESLAKSDMFTNINTRNVVKGIRDEIKFSLSMDLKGGDES